MEYHSLCIDDITSEMISDVEVRLPQRFAKAKRYKFESDFKRSIGVGVLLLRAFPDLKEETIQKNENGKLYIQNQDCFNVSHSGKYVVLVKDKNPIGVDIEQIKERRFSIAEKVFTEEEQQWMENKKERFFYLWTQKESLVKAVGCGITVPLESITVLPFERKEPVFFCDENWYCTTKQIEDYVVSICGKENFQF
ncbi:MAG: 4'-phosphopantetheinyl transferase superfamily protein [Bacteroidales bacterium]|nr:4'-phosphopantetheinyl transferase superfamily protein [Bacteroidales bacterium]